MQRVIQLIHQWMEKHLGLSAEEAERLRREYLRRYGTTFRGLYLNYGIDPAEFLHYVHNPWVLESLKPDPVLRAAILALDAQRYIFTNSSREHAERVIDRLGLDGCFDGIIDIAMFNYVSKPAPLAYEVALRTVRVPPEQCLLADDLPRNLGPAKQLGMYTVLVGKANPDGVADMTIPRLQQIVEIWPHLQRLAREQNGRQAPGNYVKGKS